MKNNIHYNLIILFLLLMSWEMSAQRYFEAENIRYRVVVEADDAPAYGTVSVAKLPDSLLSIGPSCFERCPLTHVTIPQNVELIDDDAFHCDSLSRVEILGDPSRLWVGYRIFGNNKDLEITVVPTITEWLLLYDDHFVFFIIVGIAKKNRDSDHDRCFYL